MHRHRSSVILAVIVAVAVLAIPSTALALLQNEYGMKYTGQSTCTSCHELSYGATTHGEFAKVGADPSTPGMWPAGRAGAGEIVNEDEVAFTLGAGTGLREYLVLNPAATPSSSAVAYTSLQGTNRYETAVAAAKYGFTSASTVVVATGEAFPDALGGAALAGAVNGPLLLTPAASVPASVINEIRALGATKIYVIGGTSAVSTAAFNQLDAAFGTVVRIAGSNRYATANAVAAETIKVLKAGAGFSGKAFMATGTNFPDALGASPIMFKKGMPLILVDANGNFSLPADVAKVTIVGDGSAVPSSAQTRLGTKFDRRIAGSNRYATAAGVAAYGVSLGMSWDGVGVATGENFPDALSAGPVLGSKNAVMLLTTSARLSTDAASKLSANKSVIGKCVFVGSTSAVWNYTRGQVKAILTGVTSVADLNPFVVPSLEWDPALPETWEMGAAGIEFETYTCNGCHHLGATTNGQKPSIGTFASAASATSNAWVTDPTDTSGTPDKYVAGSSIQCEVCHGTGQAGAGVANHFTKFTDYVKILRGTQLLDSQVCGQCHGRYKSGNTRGYTPDQNLLTFVTPYNFNDVPTEATWNGGINAATGKAWSFYPNGENRGLKHSYYQEWTMSGHSYRGQYLGDEANPRSGVYQQAHLGHYNAKTSDLACAKCHTGEGYAVRKGLKIVDDLVPSNTNTGFMGQECATCHVPHNAADSENDNGMGIRKPDTATTLAGITMTSVCEDCHNWQLEMQGLPLVTSPVAGKRDLTARGGFSHPQREVFNGKAMFEVADAGKYMPGTKCEQCHMPATRSDFPDKTGLGRYEDRSWKRYSHRMFIMEPGDAKSWGLAPWGDSCSPCHAGQTQDQLQTFIEEWQADATAAGDELKLAYEAAWDRNVATPDPTNAPLLGRAYYNYRTFVGDSSTGAHNPEYIVAGLKVGTKMVKSVGGEFAFVGGGAGPTGFSYVVGTIHNGDGTGAADGKLVITISGVDYDTTSDANGNFSLLYADDGTATVDSITWERCSDPAADLVAP